MTQCPNLYCQSQWGIEEIDFQECDSCGYPNFNDEDTDNDYFENDDGDDDQTFRDHLHKDLPF